MAGGRSMSTRTAAMLLGGVLLLGAALGFVPALLVPNADIHPLSVDTPHDQLFGLFPVNAADNILHALLGLWGLAWSRGSRTASRPGSRPNRSSREAPFRPTARGSPR